MKRLWVGSTRRPAIVFLLMISAGWSLLNASCSDSPGTPPPPAPTVTQTSTVPQQPGTAATPAPSETPPTPSPSPSVSASPSPTPTPSLIITWNIASETTECPFPLCKGRDGFWVRSDGYYFQGNNTPPHAHGWITPSELVQLSAVADVVANQDFLSWLTCFHTDSRPGMSSVAIKMRFTDGSTLTIYDVDTQSERTCYNGKLPEARALYNVLDTLVTKYYVLPGNDEPCAGKNAGDQCTLCSPDDPTCVETAVIKHCDHEKYCVSG
ncbi:hypothetical protein WDW37_00495 [Bdellovibrionota bacterium FG-1]